jgi:hypothetical protein
VCWGYRTCWTCLRDRGAAIGRPGPVIRGVADERSEATGAFDVCLLQQRSLDAVRGGLAVPCAGRQGGLQRCADQTRQVVVLVVGDEVKAAQARATYPQAMRRSPGVPPPACAGLCSSGQVVPQRDMDFGHRLGSSLPGTARRSRVCMVTSIRAPPASSSGSDSPRNGRWRR